ncbi:MAG: patatin-like phospholipase family protein [Deltaproteobacteria bacterium]|mgnify:CR=1 FL=1|nr:patatin-like phospholipase family protein [Deltaproteobacteria bacterium]
MSRPTQPKRRSDRPKLAIVFSGGGARGAYEAGVIKYLREDLAGDLGGHIGIDIVCGTSVGALHACFLASMADNPGQQGKLAVQRWEELVLEEIVSFGLKDFLRLPRLLLGRAQVEEMEAGERRLPGVIQTRNLEKLVRRMMPWTGIRRNLEAGHLESLAVSATDIASGKTVVFIDSEKPVPPWSADPHVRALPVRIGPRQCLASAAIPLLFPAVEVNERFYCDGGLRQNTPLSPALRLGADKVLVIALMNEKERSVPIDIVGPTTSPGAAFLVGKILNAFLLDHLDYDLHRMRRLNDLMRAIDELGDEKLKQRVRELTTGGRGSPYKIVEEKVLAPSVDLGKLAGEFARAGRFKGSGGGTGIRLLRRLATDAGGEADLLSYIMFDGNFASELAQIGYEDTRRRHDELCRFLTDCVDRE